MKLGLIGFGNHLLNTTLTIFKKNKLFDIKCFYILNQKKGKEIEKKYNIQFINKLDEFLNQNIDIIYINTPPSDHYKYIKKCIEKKINIICEKPLTLSYKETLSLYKFAEINKVFLFEVCQYTFHNHFIKLKQKILNDLKSNSKVNNFFYSSFKLPMQLTENFRIKNNFDQIIKYDLGYYPVNLIQRLFTKIKFYDEKIINFKNKEYYKNISFKSREVKGIIEWGIGFQYSNQVSYFSNNIFLETEYIFSKPNKCSPAIKILKKNKLTTMSIKEENHFLNMFDSYIKIIRQNNLRKYKLLKSNTINTIKLLSNI